VGRGEKRAWSWRLRARGEGGGEAEGRDGVGSREITRAEGERRITEVEQSWWWWRPGGGRAANHHQKIKF
jgi:hypothetical protein